MATTTPRMFCLLLALPLALAGAGLPATALRAEDGESKLGIPITSASLPFTISAPGVYSVTADLASSLQTGAAIVVAADNVTLELTML